jgi:hypothetical protein
MTAFFSASLRGLSEVRPIGALEFVRVEWWETSPRMALLKFSIGGVEQVKGLRLDLDKKALLDRLEDDGFVNGHALDNAVNAALLPIWRSVVGLVSGFKDPVERAAGLRQTQEVIFLGD